MHTNDSQAISAVLQGDKSSYEALVEKHKKMVYGIAWSHLGDSDLSEDAAQETFIKAYTYLRTLREPERFQGWLARIARNVCNSLGRRAKREDAFNKRWAVLESAEADSHGNEGGSLTEPLWESFAELPALHREALTAFYIEGKSIAEAATALGISEQALRTRLSRARTALREQLERRLEDSLGELAPSKDFTRSVLALLPLSPKGIAVGSGLAIVGKLFASLSFALWMAVAAIVPIAGIFALYSELDEASLKDTPENQGVKNLIRRGYLKVVAWMFAAFVVTWTLMSHLSVQTLFSALGFLYLYMTWRACRVLRINSSRRVIGGALAWLLLLAANVLIGFFHASFWIFPAAGLLAGIIAPFTDSAMPIVVGYNLFLHVATMGYGDLPEEGPLPQRITGPEMRAFARFLGSLWMLSDYKLRRDGMSLSLPIMRRTTITNFGLVGGSEVRISSDGKFTARLTDADRKAIRGIIRRDPDVPQIESEACRVIRYALGCFLAGDVDAARRVLVPDANSLERNPTRERNNLIKSLVTIFIGAVAVAEFLMPTGQLMVIVGASGFAIAGLILWIALYVTRRQSRSL